MRPPHPRCESERRRRAVSGERKDSSIPSWPSCGEDGGVRPPLEAGDPQNEQLTAFRSSAVPARSKLSKRFDTMAKDAFVVNGRVSSAVLTGTKPDRSYQIEAINTPLMRK